MRTTLDLPDELMRAVRIRSAEENMKLKEVVADLLRRGLASLAGKTPGVRNRVEFPLIRCAHSARPGEELTPERIAEVLLEQEVAALDSLR